MELVRINKFLAQNGICSRREADSYIEKGRVLINGQVATMGSKVSQKDVVSVDGKTLSCGNLNGPDRLYVYAYYKPVGVVCTEKDKHASKKVTDFVKAPVRVTYAGRLDKESEGLLLLTNDGRLIDCMMRGANGHEKEYVVKVDQKITGEFVERMQQGVYLKDLEVTTRPCKVTIVGPYTFRIVLTQGLNRQIRRMCEALGCQVKKLKRERVLNVTLGQLKPGEYRLLSETEIDDIKAVVGYGRK